MKKIVIHRPGGYERLKVEDHPDPVPAEGEVLVRVRAAGVNYADCLVRWGVYGSAKKYVGWPVTPGLEFSGEVVDSRDEAGRWKPGDSVFGVRLFGAYASHVAVPAEQVFAVPSTLDHQKAAAFPVAFLTAYHALFHNFPVRAGMTVLVHSAAGGVGSALVQLARVLECRVVGVVGASHKVAAVSELGADEVIDRSRVSLWDEAERLAPRGYDVILDANGPATLKDSYEHLAPLGKLVVYGFHTMLPRSRAGGKGRLNFAKALLGARKVPRFNPLQMTNRNRSVIAFNLSYVFDRLDLLADAMGDLLRWVEEGKVRLPSVTAYPLEEVAEAHRALESGQTTGKLVLVPGG